MAKSRKKSGHLNEDDYELIRNILIKTGVRLYESINSRQSPEEFAKAQLKLLRKKTSLARLFTVFRTELDPNTLNRPGEINKQIAEILADETQNDIGDITLDSNNLENQNFISPNRMTEILNSLKEFGLFSHIDSRKEMGRVMGRRKRDLDGRPSAYKLSFTASKITSLLSKPEAMEILVKSLKESGLFYRFLRHRLTGFLYAVKYASEGELANLFRIVSNHDSKQISENVRYYVSIKPLICLLDKGQIEQIAEQATIVSMQNMTQDNRDFLTRMFSFIGTSKLA